MLKLDEYDIKVDKVSRFVMWKLLNNYRHLTFTTRDNLSTLHF